MKIAPFSSFIAAAALACLASTAPAAVITFQTGTLPASGYTGGNSTYIRSDQATSNFGGQTSFIAGNVVSGADLHGLISFDLSLIPAGSTINSVSLTLFRNQDATSQSVSVQLDLLALTQPFTETGATWNTYNGTNAWTTPGGDYNPTVLSSFSANPASASSFQTFATSASFVTASQAAVNGSQPLYLIVKLDDETGLNRHIFNFSSDDNASLGQRPSLTIDYTPVPEASTALLALIGAFGLGMRGRSRSR
jgi:hypothetical protein